MKKTILATVAMTFSLLSVAQEKNNETLLSPQTVEITEKVTPFSEEVNEVYRNCSDVSKSVNESFYKEIADQHNATCLSVSFMAENAKKMRSEILEKIATKEFNPTSLLSFGEMDYANNINLISSFLIESPNEKIDVLNLMETKPELFEEDKLNDTLEELDMKYKDFKIDSTMYKNLVAAKNVLKNEFKRISDLSEKSYEDALAINKKFLEDNPEKKDLAEAVDRSLEESKNYLEGQKDRQKRMLENLDKYLKSKEKANLVYFVFNKKNPLFMETLPVYSKAECEVLKDWELGDLAKEKFEVNRIPGCKK